MKTLALVIVLLVTACNTLVPAATVTPAPVPTPTPSPTEVLPAKVACSFPKVDAGGATIPQLWLPAESGVTVQRFPNGMVLSVHAEGMMIVQSISIGRGNTVELSRRQLPADATGAIRLDLNQTLDNGVERYTLKKTLWFFVCPDGVWVSQSGESI